MKRICLPMLYGPHMVLQREKPLVISGTADGEVRSVLLEMAGKRIPADGREDLRIRAESEVRDGKFSLELPPLPAAEGCRMCLFVNGESEAELCLEDICVGEVWMACGQSNMEYFLRYDADWNRTQRLPRNPHIRMFNVPRVAFPGQQKDLSDSGFWFAEGDEAWHLFSAPGYSFARTVTERLGVPVGVIGCNWGGTPACAWMAEEYYAEEPLAVFRREYEAETARYSPEELKALSEEALAYDNIYVNAMAWQSVMYGLTLAEQEQWMEEHAGEPVLPMGPWHHYRPSGLYHMMIREAAPFGIRGFLWYQGESDSGHADIYHKTMQALVQCFRDTWEDQDLSFLFVQLAPFGRWLDCTGDNYTEVRAAQEKAAEIIPGAWMASIMDLGSYEDIHPKFKMEVGRRLALLAMGHVYGEDLLCDPPAATRAELLPGEDPLRLCLTFSDAGEGLKSDGCPEAAFEVFQGDRPLCVRGAQIREDRLILELEGLPEESAGQAGEKTLTVRFAMQDYCEVHLWNSAGLAAKPFEIRTEN